MKIWICISKRISTSFRTKKIFKVLLNFKKRFCSVKGLLKIKKMETNSSRANFKYNQRDTAMAEPFKNIWNITLKTKKIKIIS
jgi:hypothetical protein